LKTPPFSGGIPDEGLTVFATGSVSKQWAAQIWVALIVYPLAASQIGKRE
jgi:hypothetical protein